MENKQGKRGLIFTDPETQVPTNDAPKALHQKAKEEHNEAHVETWGSRKVDMNKTTALPMTIMCQTVVKGKNQHKHKARVSKQLRSDQQLQPEHKAPLLHPSLSASSLPQKKV